MTRTSIALLLLLCAAPSTAFADSEMPLEEPTAAAPAKQTSNFGKTGRFLPGEEVVGPTGKKVKVWSTEGPVSVSPPPEPFEDTRERQLPDNTHVVIEEGDIYRRQEAERRRRLQEGERPGRDSFEVPRR